MDKRVREGVEEIYCGVCDEWYEVGEVIWDNGELICAFCNEKLGRR